MPHLASILLALAVAALEVNPQIMAPLGAVAQDVIRIFFQAPLSAHLRP
jgi:hypothetical protein